MSGSGKGLLGLWLYRSGEQEWALKEGSPIHRTKPLPGEVKTEGLFDKRLKLIASSSNLPKEPTVESKAGGGDSHRNLDLSRSTADRTSIMFTLKNQVGCLAKALHVFQEMGINVMHLELQNVKSGTDQVKQVYSKWRFWQ